MLNEMAYIIARTYCEVYALRGADHLSERL
jgi:hypothetical protein